ncbi:MAG: 8-amino-7-oxononanoate synthase [Sciscionella sp.]
MGSQAQHNGTPTFDWIDEVAAARSAAGLQRTLRTRGVEESALDLAGNDYLGLARDKRVSSAAASAALRWGVGATGSRLVTGTTEVHTELERALAAFVGAQAALVFSSGFLANLGAVTALADANTAVVADRYIHASLIDGCRLSRAQVAVAEHCSPSAVGEALASRKLERALVVTDSVFSVDGDLAPLGELARLCREHGAGLLVDDAHGFGVRGTGGVGAVAEAGLSSAHDVVTTITLSKALGGQGGAVLGPRRVIEHLANAARSFMFDTALAPASAAAALAALKIMQAEPDRGAAAVEIACRIADELRASGLRASRPSSAVVALLAPSAEAALRWVADARARGILVGCFRPPSAPGTISRVRVSVRADLTETEVARAIEVLRATAPQMPERAG